MAQHTFTISTPTVTAAGAFTTDDTTSTLNEQFVTGVTGTVNGQPITGLSNFGGADNRLLFATQLRNVYSYVASGAGIGFEAGGANYNISRNDGVSTLRSSTFGNRTEAADFTDLTIIGVCFATGTMIRTVRGEVAVEGLRIGDIAVTASGSCRPIVWIGSRHLNEPGYDQRPVRVRAGAFGGGLPARGLLLSSGHPVLVGADAKNEGGVLVPVMCLINGTSIARIEVASVTYWHVELDAHDILLAEGLPAESYIDLGTRPWFDGATGALVSPDLIEREMKGRCRPVAVHGPPVEAERLRLNAVFAAALTKQCEWSAPLPA